MPAIDDVADEINRVGVVVAEKVDEFVGLRSSAAEMHVGNEKGAIMAPDPFVFQVLSVRNFIERTNARQLLHLNDVEATK